MLFQIHIDSLMLLHLGNISEDVMKHLPVSLVTVISKLRDINIRYTLPIDT